MSSSTGLLSILAVLLLCQPVDALLAPNLATKLYHSSFKVINPSISSKVCNSAVILRSTVALEGVEKQFDSGMAFSTLQGKALLPKEFPTIGEVKSALPPDTFKRSTLKSLSYALLDVVTTGTTAFLGIKYVLPFAARLIKTASLANKAAAVALWALYSAVVGTCGIGAWVTAHECGHGAFSDNKFLQDLVGYVFHTVMLVPYFSWQRSHAVHHAFSNNMVDGETHVPPVKATGQPSDKKGFQKVLGNSLGEFLYGVYQLFAHLVVGWPAYLMFGATGGPSRGFTNHFVPIQFPRPNQQGANLKELYPGAWKAKVWLSTIGIVGTWAGLFLLAKTFGIGWVAAAYGGPLLVTNAWLVGYTWLQHTDVDIPHLSPEGFTYMKGAFHTVDRPYDKMLGGLIDFLHHRIGSTHVLHHIDSTVPHYRAGAATEALKARFPDLYLYESTPIFKALWRVATKCYVVEKRKNSKEEDIYVFVDK
eukprot:gene1070-1160_t